VSGFLCHSLLFNRESRKRTPDVVRVSSRASAGDTSEGVDCADKSFRRLRLCTAHTDSNEIFKSTLESVVRLKQFEVIWFWQSFEHCPVYPTILNHNSIPFEKGVPVNAQPPCHQPSLARNHAQVRAPLTTSTTG